MYTPRRVAVAGLVFTILGTTTALVSFDPHSPEPLLPDVSSVLLITPPPPVLAPKTPPAPAPVAVVAPPVVAPPPVVGKAVAVKPEPRHELVKAAPPKPRVVRAPSSIETVIAFALAQRGKPYVWGATGPRAYDCSGLVLTAFAKIGIKLPRTTSSMIGSGRAVSRSALQRGDIVFPSSGHVAIYLGNNEIIHSPQPGEVVKISKVYAFYAARRLT
jgi:cell wall-associated NlpC family hydrolase